MGNPSIEEKRIILLQHYWDVLDKVKAYRTQLPPLVCTLNLAITSFVLNSTIIPQDSSQKYGISLIILIVTFFGLYVLWEIQKQYDLFFERITYLYDKLEMAGEDFAASYNDPKLRAEGIFSVSYMAIGLVGTICCTGVLLVSVPSIMLK